MERFYITICTIILFILTSCKSLKEADNSLTLIDIESNIKNMEVINLSKFANDIWYVPLEKRENLQLANISHLDISKDQIVISDMNVCLLYDRNGHFPLKVGNKGRGPGEFPYVKNVKLGKNEKIYLSDTENLYEYGNDGLFENKYVNSVLNESYYIPSWILIEDSLLFGHIPNSTGQEENKALITDKYGHISHFYKNYIFFTRVGSFVSSIENDAHIYNFKDNIFYKESYNDTLFYLSSDYHLIPKYSFNLGKFKEPISEREKGFKNFHPYSYIRLAKVFQTENYLFLDCPFGNHFPAKRITPKITPLLPQPIWYNTLQVLGVYNKRTRNLVFSKPTSTNNPLFTSGIYNDIDGGPRFFPMKQVNDSTMLMWVTAKDLIDHVASDDFKNNYSKYPEKKRKLEELVNNLSEFDNPVLMFVILK